MSIEVETGFRSEVKSELPLKEERTQWGTLRYMYGRASYGEEKNLPSQDYLAYKSDESKIAFAVCDGVSTAWVSHIAAQIVAERLTDFLFQMESVTDQDTFQSLIANYFDTSIQPEVDGIASSYPLSPYPPGDVARDVELRARDKDGSQTIFFAGRVNLDKRGRPVFAALVWMGNTKGAVRQNGIWNDVADGQWSDRNRWSSKKGRIGRLSVWTSALKTGDRIVIHTDGLNIIDQIQQAANDLNSTGFSTELDIDAKLKQLESFPTQRDDDITFLDLEFDNQNSNEGTISLRVLIVSLAVNVIVSTVAAYALARFLLRK